MLDEKGLNAETIVSLKITGELNDEDFITIRSMTNLKDLDLSEVNLPILFEKVFHENKKIEKIILPSTLTTIGQYAFYDCTSLHTVTFEKGSQLKTVDGFSRCTSLTTIEIPASVEKIGEFAFYICTSLQTVTFEKGSKLKTISNGAFAFCWALTTVDMSACTQVTVIGEYAFSDDSKLQLFKIGTRTPPSCGNDVFTGINSYSVLKVPAGCVDAYKKAYYWKEFTTISELDE